MKAQELLDNLRELVRLGAIEPTQSSVFHYIADHVYEARTEKGPLTDKADFVAWLHELADASRKMLAQNKALNVKVLPGSTRKKPPELS